MPEPDQHGKQSVCGRTESDTAKGGKLRNAFKGLGVLPEHLATYFKLVDM